MEYEFYGTFHRYNEYDHYLTTAILSNRFQAHIQIATRIAIVAILVAILFLTAPIPTADAHAFAYAFLSQSAVLPAS